MILTTNISECQKLLAEAQQLFESFQAKINKIQNFEFVCQDGDDSNFDDILADNSSENPV